PSRRARDQWCGLGATNTSADPSPGENRGSFSLAALAIFAAIRRASSTPGTKIKEHGIGELGKNGGPKRPVSLLVRYVKLARESRCSGRGVHIRFRATKLARTAEWAAGCVA